MECKSDTSELIRKAMNLESMIKVRCTHTIVSEKRHKMLLRDQLKINGGTFMCPKVLSTSVIIPLCAIEADDNSLDYNDNDPLRAVITSLR